MVVEVNWLNYGGWSKVFERLVSVRLGRFMERSGVLPTTQFVYRKGLGTCDALLCLSHTLQSAVESGQEARIVQIDFSAAFDRVTSPYQVEVNPICWLTSTNRAEQNSV